MPVLCLKPGWYRPGLLGGERAMAPTRLPSRRSDDSYDRVRLASGTEQTKLGVMKIYPLELHNTQNTVNRTFSKGECVLKTLVDLVLGCSKISDVPMMRVSIPEESKQWYSADNRRCFVMKVVAPLVPLNQVEVESINWHLRLITSLKRPVELAAMIAKDSLMQAIQTLGRPGSVGTG